VNDKLYGGSFTGNAFTEYGKQREPEIQKWVRDQHGIGSCGFLIRAAENPRHLATPDGIAQRGGDVLLAEIKTTNKSWAKIPRNYLRQVYWQQYVVGAERTLFVWEQHKDFVPLHSEPRIQWIERDDNAIDDVLKRAGALIAEIVRLRQASV
jgi:Holliday junction resolvase